MIVFEGQDATFSAEHGGTSFPVTAQWQVSTDGGFTFHDLPEATKHSLVIPATSLEMNGWQYRVLFSNGPTSALSDPAVLTITDPVEASVLLTPTTRLFNQIR